MESPCRTVCADNVAKKEKTENLFFIQQFHRTVHLLAGEHMFFRTAGE